MTTTIKTCFKCLVAKPLSEFYRHSMMGDGHLNKCKECAKSDVRANRSQKIGYYQQYDRDRASTPCRVAARKAYAKTENGKVRTKEAKDSWSLRNRKKRRAHDLVAKALRSGKMQPLPCWVCNSEAEAHHFDYDLPLEVVWLCDAHHKQVHKEARELRRHNSLGDHHERL